MPVNRSFGCAARRHSGRGHCVETGGGIDAETKTSSGEWAPTLREMEAIVQSAPVGIALTRGPCIVRYNPQFGEIFGLDGDRGLGEPVRFPCRTDDEYEALNRRAEPLLSVGMPFKTELWMRRNDGADVWINLACYIRDARDLQAGTVWICEDRTAFKRSEEALQRAYAEQQLILDRSAAGIVFLRDRLILRCNRRYEEILGYGPGELTGQPTRLLYSSDEAYERQGTDAYEAIARGEVFTAETTYRRRDGELFWARISGTALDPADPRRGSIWSVEDITQRKHTEQALERAYAEQKLIFDRSVVGIAFIKNRVFLRCNRRMEEMFGYDPGEMHGQSTRIYFASEEAYEAMGVRVFEVLRRGETFITESLYKRRNGELIWARLNGTAIDAADPLGGSIWAFEDITERKKVEQALQRSREELERLSRQDGLTGVANRRFFDDILRREFLRSARERSPLALVIGDTDCFKSYNDRYGHVQGDECLRRIAAEFAAVCRRPADLAARYGGEEFALILPDTPPETAANIAESLRRTVEHLAIPHAASTVSDRVTVSLGIATFVPSSGDTPQLLVESADRALYEAKQQGRNRYVVSRRHLER